MLVEGRIDGASGTQSFWRVVVPLLSPMTFFLLFTNVVYALFDSFGLVDILTRVRNLDVLVAIDDFGTGYSSLAYLVTLPVYVLKIDRSFVIKMAQDSGYMGLVQTIVSLAHNLELEVVAEGIEKPEEAKLLKLLRCEYGQGNLYGKPVPAEEFAALLKK